MDVLPTNKFALALTFYQLLQLLLKQFLASIKVKLIAIFRQELAILSVSACILILYDSILFLK